MKLVCVVTATLAAAVYAAVPQRTMVPSAPQPLLTDSKVRMPVSFEPNRGQAPGDVRWLSRAPGRTFMLTGTEALMMLGESTVRMKMIGSRTQPQTEGVDRLEATSNYFIGNNPAEWQTAVPHYARVRYKNVYPGIDVVYYGSDRHLEYDFIVAPGADPKRIELAYEGADRMRVESNGDLVLEVNGRTLRQLRPKVYQEGRLGRREVAGSYRIRSGNKVEFALAAYDRASSLVIDPVIQYSTYLGQEGRDVAVSVATDATGSIYMTGQTTSTRFPTGQNAQPNPGGKLEAFAAKFTGSGELTWVTYIGGRENEVGRGVAVDSAGNTYVVGFTSSDNFPLRNATYPDFKGGGSDAFLTKLSPNGQQFLYSTYVGGTGYDDAFGVAVSADGDAYVAGATESFDFPVRNGFQTPFGRRSGHVRYQDRDRASGCRVLNLRRRQRPGFCQRHRD